LKQYEFLDADERYRLLIDLGRKLEAMPDALKTDATLVRGCSASVWVYPVAGNGDALHFLADSNAAITKGIVALVLAAVQDRPAREVAANRYRRTARPVRSQEPALIEPHAGRPQHDRPRARTRRADRGIT
jgi:sulfur transfer protein SufE